MPPEAKDNQITLYSPNPLSPAHRLSPWQWVSSELSGYTIQLHSLLIHPLLHIPKLVTTLNSSNPKWLTVSHSLPTPPLWVYMLDNIYCSLIINLQFDLPSSQCIRSFVSQLHSFSLDFMGHNFNYTLAKNLISFALLISSLPSGKTPTGWIQFNCLILPAPKQIQQEKKKRG